MFHLWEQLAALLRLKLCVSWAMTLRGKWNFYKKDKSVAKKHALCNHLSCHWLGNSFGIFKQQQVLWICGKHFVFCSKKATKGGLKSLLMHFMHITKSWPYIMDMHFGYWILAKCYLYSLTCFWIKIRPACSSWYPMPLKAVELQQQ